MLDIRFIRENPQLVEEKAKQKGYPVDIPKLLKVDNERRRLIEEVDRLRSERKRAADARDEKKGKELREKLKQKEDKLEKIEQETLELSYQIPNLPLEGVPLGDESKNKIIKKVGSPPKFDFPPKDHLELGEKHDIIDIPRAAKVSGTRFAYLKNEGALLELALIQFAMENLVKEGFTPVFPPILIRKKMTDKLGYWHGKIDEKHSANENYYLVYDPNNESGEERESSLYLIGTGEHSIAPMHSDETLNAQELPKRYAAFSSSFRREAGSYGRDTRGILRVHQFDKVEMVSFVRPEDDEEERRKLLSLAEKLMQALNLPYQLVKLASEDLPFPTAETIDIETWVPSENKYRETHSISTTTDFQARRLNIRFKQSQPGSMALMGVGGSYRVEYVHILNGTAFAIGRTLIAIMENYQAKDGSIEVPKVLQPYTSFKKIPA